MDQLVGAVVTYKQQAMATEKEAKKKQFFRSIVLFIYFTGTLLGLWIFLRSRITREDHQVCAQLSIKHWKRKVWAAVDKESDLLFSRER